MIPIRSLARLAGSQMHLALRSPAIQLMTHILNVIRSSSLQLMNKIHSLAAPTKAAIGKGSWKAGLRLQSMLRKLWSQLMPTSGAKSKVCRSMKVRITTIGTKASTLNSISSQTLPLSNKQLLLHRLSTSNWWGT